MLLHMCIHVYVTNTHSSNIIQYYMCDAVASLGHLSINFWCYLKYTTSLFSQSNIGRTCIHMKSNIWLQVDIFSCYVPMEIASCVLFCHFISLIHSYAKYTIKIYIQNFWYDMWDPHLCGDMCVMYLLCLHYFMYYCLPHCHFMLIIRVCIWYVHRTHKI